MRSAALVKWILVIFVCVLPAFVPAGAQDEADEERETALRLIQKKYKTSDVLDRHDAVLAAMELVKENFKPARLWLLSEVYKHETNPEIKLIALGCLQNLQGPKVAQELLDFACTSPYPSVRLRAARLLPRLDKETRALAIDCLGQLLINGCTDSGSVTIATPDAAIAPLARYCAALALGHIGDDASMALLLKGLASEDSVVKAASVRGWGYSRREAGCDEVVKMAADSGDYDLRAAALLALIRNCTAPACDALKAFEGKVEGPLVHILKQGIPAAAANAELLDEISTESAEGVSSVDWDEFDAQAEVVEFTGEVHILLNCSASMAERFEKALAGALDLLPEVHANGIYSYSVLRVYDGTQNSAPSDILHTMDRQKAIEFLKASTPAGKDDLDFDMANALSYVGFLPLSVDTPDERSVNFFTDADNGPSHYPAAKELVNNLADFDRVVINVYSLAVFDSDTDKQLKEWARLGDGVHINLMK